MYAKAKKQLFLAILAKITVLHGRWKVVFAKRAKNSCFWPLRTPILPAPKGTKVQEGGAGETESDREGHRRTRGRPPRAPPSKRLRRKQQAALPVAYSLLFTWVGVVKGEGISPPPFPLTPSFWADSFSDLPSNHVLTPPRTLTPSCCPGYPRNHKGMANPLRVRPRPWPGKFQNTSQKVGQKRAKNRPFLG